jgi:predicted nucleotidyltransferase
MDVLVNMKQLIYDQRRLESLFRDYQVQKLSVFGSVLNGEDTPASDLDLLLEFKPESRVGMFGFVRLQRELGEVFGRTVDLNTAGFLNRAFRNEVVQHAKAIYTG